MNPSVLVIQFKDPLKKININMKNLYILCCVDCQHKPLVTKAFVTNNPVFVICTVFIQTIWQCKSNRRIKSTKCFPVPCCTCRKFAVIINACVYSVYNLCNVSIHLLFVLPSGRSGGSGMEDGRAHIPPNLLQKEGNPPSDPSASEVQKYPKLVRLIHTNGQSL